MKFTQNTANGIFALCATWTGTIAVGLVPDNVYTHWISFAATFAQLYLVNLGFRRTPNGNVIPQDIEEHVDSLPRNNPPAKPVV